jgi:SAM-dependent methyltransferase
MGRILPKRENIMNTELNRTVLRTVFDESALDYDAVRPGYPEELMAEIITRSSIPSGGSILEVGCGTGQATLPFARRGYRMVCLDIGAQLLALAREKCRSYSQVVFHLSSFEDWQPALDERFDLMISATAFHWVPPEIGYPKVAAILKDAGHMAIFKSSHPTPFTGFAEAVQPIYDRYMTDAVTGGRKYSLEAEIAATVNDIKGCGKFSEIVVQRYPWSKTFTSDEYLRLLNTFSDHRNLPDATRESLFADIKRLMDAEYGGHVERPYVTVLYLAQKR